MLRGNKVLTSLSVRSCGIGPVGLSKLCTALKENTTLTSLDLSNGRIDDRTVDNFGKLLIITVAVMTCALHVKYHLHDNSYNKMDLECVYIEFDNLNFNYVA